MTSKDCLGDRMKKYEAQYSQRLLAKTYVICRIDGKSFHTFTRGLSRPYDTRLSTLMVETTKHLIKEAGAKFGYTQSDEISLLFYTVDIKSELPFGGKVNKFNSILSSMATFYFNRGKCKVLPEKVDTPAYFDCRTFVVPKKDEVVNYFLWRERDAVKNSISMAAQSLYSHKELQGKHSGDMQEMLFAKGKNWNDYPKFFKSGTYLQRKVISRTLSPSELKELPKNHEAHKNPNLHFLRNAIIESEFDLTHVKERCENNS
jgi:tRNA(His) 5'-end guanylyltransferase